MTLTDLQQADTICYIAFLSRFRSRFASITFNTQLRITLVKTRIHNHSSSAPTAESTQRPIIIDIHLGRLTVLNENEASFFFLLILLIIRSSGYFFATRKLLFFLALNWFVDIFHFDLFIDLNKLYKVQAAIRIIGDYHLIVI